MNSEPTAGTREREEELACRAAGVDDPEEEATGMREEEIPSTDSGAVEE
jgi:hypothetical protein